MVKGDETDALTFTDTPLEGATVKTLESTAFDEATGALTLNFADATYIEAGLPYIVKWTSGDSETSPEFKDVSIIGEQAWEATPDDGWVSFVGTYSPAPIYEDGTEKHNLYLGSDNTLYYPTVEGLTVNPFRAYFRLNGLTVGALTDPSATVRAFVLNFGESEATGVKSIGSKTIYSLLFDADAWYTTSGVKLQAKPKQRGVYINNGRKVVIK